MALPTAERDRLVLRTQMASLAGLRMAPFAVFLFVFAVGELGWHLGTWFLPTLAASAVAVLVATPLVESWYRSRFGRVRLRTNPRVVAVVVVLSVAYVVSQARIDPGTLPVYPSGILLGGVIAALAWPARRALAQHLVVGGLIAVASALPLGLVLDVPVPPAAAQAYADPVHPVAAYQTILISLWLAVTGVVEHVRMSRHLGAPVVVGAEGSGAPS